MPLAGLPWRGKGWVRPGNPASTSTLPHFFKHRPQGGQGREEQGYLWEGFSGQLGVPPRPKWQPGDMHCHCWGQGTPGSLQGPLGSVIVQTLSRVQLLVTPWTTVCQASLSFTISWSLLKLMSIESVMPSNHLVFCRPFSSGLLSFPASGSFPMRLFTSSGQSFGASALASVLPMNIQD